jgi:hypothetical protein
MPAQYIVYTPAAIIQFHGQTLLYLYNSIFIFYFLFLKKKKLVMLYRNK